MIRTASRRPRFQGRPAAPVAPGNRIEHEPVESDRTADTNAVLDAVECGIRQVIEAGGEFALRQRLARLLPGEAGA